MSHGLRCASAALAAGAGLLSSKPLHHPTKPNELTYYANGPWAVTVLTRGGSAHIRCEPGLLSDKSDPTARRLPDLPDVDFELAVRLERPPQSQFCIPQQL